MNEADSSLQGTVSLLTDEVRACVGTTVSYTAPEELGRASIRAYAMAIGAPADRSPDEAPPTLIFDTCQLTGKTQSIGLPIGKCITCSGIKNSKCACLTYSLTHSFPAIGTLPGVAIVKASRPDVFWMITQMNCPLGPQ